MAKKTAGRKRGPKKGYKQSPQHIARRRKALKAAWKQGKFKNRKPRGSKARRTEKRATRRTKRKSVVRRRRATVTTRRAKRGRRKARRS